MGSGCCGRKGGYLETGEGQEMVDEVSEKRRRNFLAWV